jgi:serine protease AprX
MNLLPIWLRKWRRPRCAPKKPIRHRSPLARLTVETLEDRLIPSANPLSDPTYALWRQQRFTVDDVTVAHSAAPASPAASVSAPTNASFGALIGLNQVLGSTPYRGDGYSVAVIDTGINYNDPNLGGGWGHRVIAGYNFVSGTTDPIDDNGHGTFVASEIGSSSSSYAGVAPDVNLIALKVLDSTGSGTYGNVQNALEWVIAHQAQYHIVAVNLSLGSGNYTMNPYTFLESDLATLKSEGVFIAVAAGNSYYTDGGQPGLAYPAVSSNVVSVGAVWVGSFGSVSWASGARDYSTAADQIASFSQRSAALSLLAPGAILVGDALHGGLTSMAGTSMATPVIAGAAALLHQALDARGLSADANQDYILQLMQSTGKLVVDVNTGADNVSHTGLSFRRIDLAAALSALPTINQGPTISPIADQTVHAGHSVTVKVSVSGASTWQAQAFTPAEDAAFVEQQYKLVYTGNWYYNLYGLGEKWLWSYTFGGLAVGIFPDGSVRHYDPAGARAMLGDGDLLGRVDPAYYANPLALVRYYGSASVPGGDAGSVAIAGAQLTVTPTAPFTGSLYVVVTATDGSAAARRTFVVNVADTPPSIAPIADQAIRVGQSATVNVAANDSDGNTLPFQAQVLSAAQDAFAVEQQYKLVYTGTWHYNLYGLGEKWLWSYAFGGLAVCILPDGSVRHYDPAGPSAILGDGDLLGRVDPACYADPTQLIGYYGSMNAPGGSAGSASISGTQLTVTPSDPITGPIFVVVTASDSTMTSHRTFVVTVTDAPPVIGAIADQSIRAGQSAAVSIPVSNPAGGPITWQAQVMTAAQDAYAVVQRLKLVYTGDWHTNLKGMNEKWFWSYAYGGLAVCILPDGSIRHYDPAGVNAMLSDRNLLGRVDAAYYADPRLLVGVTAPASNAPPAALWLTGSRLTVTPSAGVTGSLFVEIVASAGGVSARKTFVVAVR